MDIWCLLSYTIRKVVEVSTDRGEHAEEAREQVGAAQGVGRAEALDHPREAAREREQLEREGCSVGPTDASWPRILASWPRIPVGVQL
jgi:hypothetical protein